MDEIGDPHYEDHYDGDQARLRRLEWMPSPKGQVLTIEPNHVRYGGHPDQWNQPAELDVLAVGAKIAADLVNPVNNDHGA